LPLRWLPLRRHRRRCDRRDILRACDLKVAHLGAQCRKLVEHLGKALVLISQLRLELLDRLRLRFVLALKARNMLLQLLLLTLRSHSRV
jgi:hypothetical protein